jgi:hypothetical protein
LTGPPTPPRSGSGWPAKRKDRHDGVGALNLITLAKRLEASAAVRSGEAFSLGFELQPNTLVYMGMILGEVFELDALAAACAAAGQWRSQLQRRSANSSTSRRVSSDSERTSVISP